MDKKGIESQKGLKSGKLEKRVEKRGESWFLGRRLIENYGHISLVR